MKRKIHFVLCLLVGLLFLNAGLNKFFNYLPVPDDLPESQLNMFMAIMQIGWLFPLIGAAEILGGILFIIPRFRVLGALILCPIFIGIILATIAVSVDGLPLVLGMLVIWGWALFENRNRLIPLIKY